MTEISAYLAHSLGACPKELSKNNSTLALPIGSLESVPLKITESIDSPRISLAEDDPRTHLTDSIMFDLPQPFGPTIPAN